MIDALVGGVIALVATGAITLMLDVMVNSEASTKSALSDYEQSVFSSVAKQHPDSATTEESFLEWIKLKGSQSLSE